MKGLILASCSAGVAGASLSGQELDLKTRKKPYVVTYYVFFSLLQHKRTLVLYFLGKAELKITGVTVPARNYKQLARELLVFYPSWSQLQFFLQVCYSAPFINTYKCKLLKFSQGSVLYVKYTDGLQTHLFIPVSHLSIQPIGYLETAVN